MLLPQLLVAGLAHIVTGVGFAASLIGWSCSRGLVLGLVGGRNPADNEHHQHHSQAQTQELPRIASHD